MFCKRVTIFVLIFLLFSVDASKSQDQIFEPDYDEATLYDRDFGDEMTSTDQFKIYRMKIQQRDDFHITSFSELDIKLKLVHPPPEDGVSIACLVTLENIRNVEVAKTLYSSSAVYDAASFTISASNLRNYPNLHIVFKITNTQRANVVFEVQIKCKRSPWSMTGFILSALLLILGPHLTLSFGFKTYYVISCGVLYMLMSNERIFNFCVFIFAFVAAIVTGGEKNSKGKKSVVLNDKFWKEQAMYIDVFLGYQNTIAILSSLIASLAVAAFLEEILESTTRTSARSGSDHTSIGRYVIFYVIGTILMIQSVNAPVGNLVVLSAAFLGLPIIMKKL